MPSEKQSAQNQFLDDITQNQPVDIMDQPLEPVQTPDPVQGPTGTDGDDDDQPRGNRRERRLQERYQAERESSIALAARLEALTEAQKLSREQGPSEYVKQVERIYGTNSPEAQEATNLLAAALEGVETRATERALELFRAEQEQMRRAEAAEERALDDMVYNIEDQYNVVLDSATQKSFFQLLEKLSPKDEDGNIVNYADPYAVWEELQTRKQPQTRQKDLASRSMTKPSGTPTTSVEQDAHERWLKENGII